MSRVSVNGAAPVTRSMTGGVGASFTDVTEVRFGFTQTLGATIAFYDDLRIDWN